MNDFYSQWNSLFLLLSKRKLCSYLLSFCIVDCCRLSEDRSHKHPAVFLDCNRRGQWSVAVQGRQWSHCHGAVQGAPQSQLRYWILPSICYLQVPISTHARREVLWHSQWYYDEWVTIVCISFISPLSQCGDSERRQFPRCGIGGIRPDFVAVHRWWDAKIHQLYQQAVHSQHRLSALLGRWGCKHSVRVLHALFWVVGFSPGLLTGTFNKLTSYRGLRESIGPIGIGLWAADCSKSV